MRYHDMLNLMVIIVFFDLTHFTAPAGYSDPPQPDILFLQRF
nr:hypothetical protein [Morganella morganii]